MKALEERIRREGKVFSGEVVKVDNFLNHLVDTQFMGEIGKEFHRIFVDTRPSKVLTIEASGIAIAMTTAQAFGVPLLFAKKTQSLNLDSQTYTAEVYSYTREKPYKIKVSRQYLLPRDRVLIIDDFLARGSASHGLIDLVEQAGAHLCGVGIVVEKTFQEGGKLLREAGVNLHSLAMIKHIAPPDQIDFAVNPDDSPVD